MNFKLNMCTRKYLEKRLTVCLLISLFFFLINKEARWAQTTHLRIKSLMLLLKTRADTE